jgi:hypothetical protein
VEYGGRLSLEQFWAHMDEMERRLREDAPALPWFGIAGWQGLIMTGDCEWENGRLRMVGLVHGAPLGDSGRVQVLTTVDDPRRQVASFRMAPPHGAGGDALQRMSAAEAPPTDEAEILVERAPLRFDVWRQDDRWWAASQYGAYGLVLEARKVPIEELTLVRVHDLEPYLAGRREYLRTLRGET